MMLPPNAMSSTLLPVNIRMAKRGASAFAQGNGSEIFKRVKLQRPAESAEAVKRGILKKSSTREGSPPHESKRQVGVLKSNGKTTSIRASSNGKGKAKETILQNGNNASAPTIQIPQRSATAFEVVAGSYERLLYGLHCSLSGSGPSASVDMQPVFQFPAHLSCVKTVHASPNGRWLATGAGDEIIKVWDLRRRREIGGLLGHDGGSRH